MSQVTERPKTEWTCSKVLDAKAGDPDGSAACEFCNTKIRWVHLLEHNDYHRPVEAGVCCAARLCWDYDADAAEREVKNRAARQQTFLDRRKWKPSKRKPGNIWRKVNTERFGKVTVTVFRRADGKHSVYIAGGGDEKHCDAMRFSDQDAALKRAFFLVEKLMSEPREPSE